MANKKNIKYVKIANLKIPTEITFEITQDNIENGEQSDGAYCPIAQSVTETLPEVDTGILCVDSDGITVNLGNGLVGFYSIPAKAKKFINAFDNASSEEIFDSEGGYLDDVLDRSQFKPFKFIAKLKSLNNPDYDYANA